MYLFQLLLKSFMMSEYIRLDCMINICSALKCSVLLHKVRYNKINKIITLIKCSISFKKYHN